MARHEDDWTDAERLEHEALRRQGLKVAELEAKVVSMNAEIVVLHKRVRTLRDEIRELKKARR